MPLTVWDEFASGAQKGGSVREDLQDFIEILSPRDTPLFNNLGSHPVNAGFVEYMEDTLNAAAENAFIQGAAATDQVLGVPSRRASICQIFQKHMQVAGTQRAVLHAGMSDMLMHQEEKRLRELKNDIELALHRGTAASGGTTTAAKLDGLLSWGIGTSGQSFSAFTNTSSVTLNEQVFNDVLTLTYNNPVNLRELYTHMKVKRKINSFSSSVQRYIAAEAKKQLQIIDVYEAESGVLAIFKSRYQFDGGLAGTAADFSHGSSWVAIDPDYFSIGWLRPVHVQEFGRDGDRDRRAIVAEGTLIARSSRALAGQRGVGLTLLSA